VSEIFPGLAKYLQSAEIFIKLQKYSQTFENIYKESVNISSGSRNIPRALKIFTKEV